MSNYLSSQAHRPTKHSVRPEPNRHSGPIGTATAEPKPKQQRRHDDLGHQFKDTQIRYFVSYFFRGIARIPSLLFSYSIDAFDRFFGRRWQHYVTAAGGGVVWVGGHARRGPPPQTFGGALRLHVGVHCSVCVCVM